MKKSGDFTGRHTADSTADTERVLVTNYGKGAGSPPADKEGRHRREIQRLHFQILG
jgi:hypothetical protein